ncbi:MAG: ABC transporter substrate-binding protein [Alphaproteobacteria bacterium]|nr:ABC transporter substrate-binding protein [Alphaproteobacteria bacterium]
MTSFRRRQILKGALATLAAVAPATAALAQAEPPKPAQIVINDSGGAMQSAMRQLFYSEFERRYGIKVVATSPVDLGKLQAQVQTGNVEWTVTEIGGEDAIRAERSGLLERLDLKIIDLSRFPKHLQNRAYVFPKAVYSTVMGYRSDVFKEGQRPKSWADFWDVAKFPGPRTLQNSPTDNLEFALLADGVAADKLYPLDVDRAFRKLDQIKKHIAVWWTTGAQSAQLLIDKEAVLGTAWNGRYYAAIAAGAPLVMEWNQGSIKESAFGIPKGAKNAYWGQKFLALAAEAEPQGKYADIIGYPGLNLDATKFTDPKMIPYLPTSPDNLPKQFWTDLAWWADNGNTVKERWSRWMLQQ